MQKVQAIFNLCCVQSYDLRIIYNSCAYLLTRPQNTAINATGSRSGCGLLPWQLLWKLPAPSQALQGSRVNSSLPTRGPTDPYLTYVCTRRRTETSIQAATIQCAFASGLAPALRYARAHVTLDPYLEGIGRVTNSTPWTSALPTAAQVGACDATNLLPAQSYACLAESPMSGPQVSRTLQRSTSPPVPQSTPRTQTRI